MKHYSEISDFNKIVLSTFSGITVVAEKSGNKLVQSCYGDEAQFLAFIRRLTNSQSILLLHHYNIPSISVNLREVIPNGSKLRLHYDVIFVALSKDESFQILEKVLILNGQKIDQDGHHFIHKDKFAMLSCNEVFLNYTLTECSKWLNENKEVSFTKVKVIIDTNVDDKPVEIERECLDEN